MRGLVTSKGEDICEGNAQGDPGLLMGVITKNIGT